jgi:hypothetical protein
MPDDSNFSDKRRSERVAANFEVAFREISEEEAAAWTASIPDEVPWPGVAPAGLAPEPHHAPAPLSGQTVNLSDGGLSMTGDLQLLGDHRLDRGKKLMVQFSLPGYAEKVSCAAVVAWSLEGRGDKGKFTAGLMFLGMLPGDLEKIQKYVEHSQ